MKHFILYFSVALIKLINLLSIYCVAFVNASVFNILTGLNQKVGNYPGITVEKKEGMCKLPRGVKAHILDLPGTYSLNASSLDENVVIELLLNKNDKDFPEVAIVVADIENLKRNLLLFTQIKDLGVPTILAINMADRMKRKAISGMVMPSGTSGRNASPCSTLLVRFSGTK